MVYARFRRRWPSHRFRDVSQQRYAHDLRELDTTRSGAARRKMDCRLFEQIGQEAHVEWHPATAQRSLLLRFHPFNPERRDVPHRVQSSSSHSHHPASGQFPCFLLSDTAHQVCRGKDPATECSNPTSDMALQRHHHATFALRAAATRHPGNDSSFTSGVLSLMGSTQFASPRRIAVPNSSRPDIDGRRSTAIPRALACLVAQPSHQALVAGEKLDQSKCRLIGVVSVAAGCLISIIADQCQYRSDLRGLNGSTDSWSRVCYISLRMTVAPYDGHFYWHLDYA